MVLTKKTIVLASLLYWVMIPDLAAQFIGPQHLVIKDLNTVLENPKDDQQVLLQGYLIKKVGSDKYIFSNGQQEIRVEIDDFVFPKQPFDDKQRIQIMGEVEKDFLQSPEIDVDHLQIIKE